MTKCKTDASDKNEPSFGVNEDGTTFPVIFGDDGEETVEETEKEVDQATELLNQAVELLNDLIDENPGISCDEIEKLFIAEVEADPDRRRAALEYFLRNKWNAVKRRTLS
jgi:hypothetical protein